MNYKWLGFIFCLYIWRIINLIAAMKKTVFTLLTIFIVSSLSFSQKKTVYADDYIVKVGDMSPEFIINEAGGKSYKLSDLRG